MKIKEAMGDLTWKGKGQNDKGFYFTLTDSKNGHDYEVAVSKDTGEVQMNNGYIKTVPRDIQEFAAMKLKQSGVQKQPTEGEDKKPTKKASTKKMPAKKAPEKKDEKKEPAKKTPVKKEPAKKDEKKK